MPTATIQVPVLMSRSQKSRLSRKAKAAKLTMAELLRQGAEHYSPNDDVVLLDQFAKQVTQATRKAIRSIDKTLATVAESEARIQALLKSKRKS